jgi:hypothetical protein
MTTYCSKCQKELEVNKPYTKISFACEDNDTIICTDCWFRDAMQD